MFQFTGFPSMRYGLAHGWLEFVQPGFPIQKSAALWIFAPPRSLSQLITSFFGSQCQGIRPVLFLAWPGYEHLATVFWSLTCEACKLLGEVLSNLVVCIVAVCRNPHVLITSSILYHAQCSCIVHGPLNLSILLISFYYSWFSFCSRIPPLCGFFFPASDVW